MAPPSVIDKSLAVAIACTGDKERLKRPAERPFDLLTLARHLELLRQEYGSQTKVGEKIRLKGRTVGQLIASLKCHEKLQQLISDRKIDSMDAVCKIAQLPRDDQPTLGEEVVKRGLNSKDVRAIVKYRMDNPSISVTDAITRVLDSKDRKTFTVLMFLDECEAKLPHGAVGVKLLHKEFELVVGKASLLSLEMRGAAMSVGVTPAGMKLLRREAKRLKIPQGQLADALCERALCRKERRKRPSNAKRDK